jgi:hypothetical protein
MVGESWSSGWRPSRGGKHQASDFPISSSLLDPDRERHTDVTPRDPDQSVDRPPILDIARNRREPPGAVKV